MSTIALPLSFNQDAAKIAAAYIFPRLLQKERNQHWTDVFITATALAHDYESPRVTKLTTSLSPGPHRRTTHPYGLKSGKLVYGFPVKFVTVIGLNSELRHQHLSRLLERLIIDIVVLQEYLTCVLVLLTSLLTSPYLVGSYSVAKL